MGYFKYKPIGVGQHFHQTSAKPWAIIVAQKSSSREKESPVSMGGAIILLALFPQTYIIWQQHNMSPSCDPYSQIKDVKKKKNIPIPRNNKQESTSFFSVTLK